MRKALLLFLAACLFSGSVVHAEKKPDSHPNNICGCRIIEKRLREVPEYLLESFSRLYEDNPNYTNVDPIFVKRELRKVFLNLEQEGIDTRQLFGGAPLTVYATDAYFGKHRAFAVWYGHGDERNAILLGGVNRGNFDPGLAQHIAHEMGHMIYFYYFDEEAREEYRKTRDIPRNWNDDMEWGKRPMEIFAEDFARLFGDPSNYMNKTSMKALAGNEGNEIRKLIIKQIKAKQNGEIRLENEDQKRLMELKKSGIIPEDEFLLCELADYEKEPISNKEFIDWLFRAVMFNHKIQAFGDMKELGQTYVGLSNLYIDKNASKQEILNILGAFSPYIDISEVNTWDVVGFVNSDYEVITKGIAARIVSNFVNLDSSKDEGGD